MVNFLRRIGQWFIGKSEKIEKLDEEVKLLITSQNKRALGLGFCLGVFVTLLILKLL